jgi:transcriptional regulator with XRE-family HTH domain
MSTPASVIESLGTTVRIERIRRRWRQSDLALAADVTQADVSQLERDRKVVPSRRLRILEALGINRETVDG